MNSEWHELLDRALDGDALTDAEAHALAEALREPRKRCEARDWLVFDAELRSRLARAPGPEAQVSRERLLAKAALRQKSRARRAARDARRRRRRWVAATTAVAAVLAIAVVGRLWIGRGTPEFRATGDYRLFGTNISRPLRRGDRLQVGQAGAGIRLSDYCQFDLEEDADVVLHGEPGNEAVELKEGTLVARVAPGKGTFHVRTPLGTLEVLGTEFVAAVEHRNAKEGDRTMGTLGRSAVVTVMVVSGMVGFELGGLNGQLGPGAARAFAGGDREASALPDGMRGFRGMLVGTIVAKGKRELVLQVESIGAVWKQNRADRPQNAVGRKVMISLWPKSRLYELHLMTLGKMERGDRIVVEAFHLEGTRLHVVELLRKAEAPPETLPEGEAVEWERREKKRDGWEGEKKDERRERDEDAEWREKKLREKKEDAAREEAARREKERAKWGEEKADGEAGWDEEWLRKTEKEVREWQKEIEREDAGGEWAEKKREGEWKKDEEWRKKQERAEKERILREKKKRAFAEREGEWGEKKREGEWKGGDAEWREKKRREEKERMLREKKERALRDGEGEWREKKRDGDREGEWREKKRDGDREGEWGEKKRDGDREGEWREKKRDDDRVENEWGDAPREKREEKAEEGAHDGFQGFRGMLNGTVVAKGEKALVVRVKEITKLWQSNLAKKPESMVGRTMTIVLAGDRGVPDAILKTLRGLKVGDTVSLAATHEKGNRLVLAELLRKIGKGEF